MPDHMPTPTDDTVPPVPTMRRICYLAAPRQHAPSLADRLRAAVVWAQMFQEAKAAGERAKQETDAEQ
jgi:hypothetical protein